MPRPNVGPHLRLRTEPGRPRTWIIEWFERGRRRRRSCQTEDRAAAERQLAALLGERHARAGGDVTVGTLIVRYVEARRDATDPERIRLSAVPIARFFGDRLASTLTPSDCQAYARQRKAAPGTIRRELSTLRAALGLARQDGLLSVIPPLWQPRAPRHRDRWMTRAETARLLKAAKAQPHLARFILIALYTGARRGAVLQLTWNQVDLDRRIIVFLRAEGETAKRRAIVPIHRRLATFLDRWRQRDAGPHVIHYEGRSVTKLRRSWQTACARANLGADVTPHTLRHTAGTWMAQAGVDLFVIARYLGHSAARTTELYAHHHPDFLRAAHKGFR